MDWARAARSRRESLLSSFPAQWRLDPADIPSVSQLIDVTGYICRTLSNREIAITNASAADILQKIATFEWSSVEVTRAFCHRAALAHQLTNCLSLAFFQDAAKRAEELDDHILRTGEVVGPMHGLPMSFQDRFNIAGYDSACGHIAWLNRLRNEKDEGALVKKLKEAGAVFFAKTNVPMSMLMGETCNNIIGTTINPYNRNLSAGGASGGEGALLALRGSPLGWASDIAGSIRIPCAFNNLYGLRPSFGRLPQDGLVTSLPGLPTGGSVQGPMASDLSSLLMATKWIINTTCWKDDFEVVDIPWRANIYKETRSRMCQPGQRDGALVFAILKCDKGVRPHPPVLRAMNLVTEALLARGYEVVEWDPPEHGSAVDIIMQILGSTAGQTVRNAIDASREPPVEHLKEWYQNTEQEPSSTADFWKLCEERESYRARYNEYWNATRSRTRSKRPVDGVIMPVAPTAAVEHMQFKYYGYSAIVNMLDYTSGSIPVTFADRALDPSELDYIPKNPRDLENWQSYRKEISDGAPVGLQLMARRFQEEKVLAMMEAVENALQLHSKDTS